MLVANIVMITGISNQLTKAGGRWFVDLAQAHKAEFKENTEQWTCIPIFSDALIQASLSVALN